jgi:hypothetical protein
LLLVARIRYYSSFNVVGSGIGSENRGLYMRDTRTGVPQPHPNHSLQGVLSFYLGFPLDFPRTAPRLAFSVELVTILHGATPLAYMTIRRGTKLYLENCKDSIYAYTYHVFLESHLKTQNMEK